MNSKTEQKLRSSNASYCRNLNEYDEVSNLRQWNREDLKYIIYRPRCLDIPLVWGVEKVVSKREKSKLINLQGNTIFLHSVLYFFIQHMCTEP